MLPQIADSQKSQAIIAPSNTFSTFNNENISASDKKELVICPRRAVFARLEKPNVNFDHLIGLENPISELRMHIILPFLLSQQIKLQKDSDYPGILLYGPPGGGKTSLAQACAAEMNANFFIVQGRDFKAYIKTPQKFIKELFKTARTSSPACIVFENIDDIFLEIIGASEKNRRAKTEFLVQMEDVINNPQVIVIGTSENPWLLPPAIRRRFSLRIPVFPPDHPARIMFLSQKLLHVEHSLKTEDIIMIADLTEDYSYKNLADLIRLASYEPVRELQKAKYFKLINKENQIYEVCDPTDSEAQEISFLDIPYESVKQREIIIDDFYKALKRISAYVEPIHMPQYHTFFENFREG